MEIRRFDLARDLDRLQDFLRAQYRANHNITSWLPQRLNDVIFRLDTQHLERYGGKMSRDYIFLWEEDGEIAACTLPDGDAIYAAVKNGYEALFPALLTYAETHCLDLFTPNEDGSYTFLFVVNDSLSHCTQELQRRGYEKQAEQDYDNYAYPMEDEIKIELPAGYRVVYGEEIPDEPLKGYICEAGFHPEKETDGTYVERMEIYNARKAAPLYPDSFECMVQAPDGDLCCYSFTYVDTATRTAWIEPVSTRLKYRRMGIGTAMMHGVLQRCREKGVEKCYVNSYSWRRKFYNAAGFRTEDSIGLWTKKI
ncbi:MAG: GNAT family N-acetyltransferase [Clostridia bacterium]|nr:GNAT family N-acetyltransferase [Clostridia bacterium]